MNASGSYFARPLMLLCVFICLVLFIGFFVGWVPGGETNVDGIQSIGSAKWVIVGIVMLGFFAVACFFVFVIANKGGGK